MMADPMLADTSIETLRALRAGAHRTDAHGPDSDEGVGCEASREEKLIMCVSSFDCEKCFGIESANLCVGE